MSAMITRADFVKAAKRIRAVATCSQGVDELVAFMTQWEQDVHPALPSLSRGADNRGITVTSPSEPKDKRSQ